MKGLIAKRPILYRGRMYQAGDNLPGDDARMVDAWLENDSAERCGESQNNAPDGAKGAQDGAQNTQDGQDGAKGAQDGAQNTQDTQDGAKGAQDGAQNTQDGQDGAKGAQDGAQNTQDTQDGGMIAGHLDPKDLESLKKADLERMATDMGLEISEAKTKADLIAVITAAEVYAPAENENGGAQ